MTDDADAAPAAEPVRWWRVALLGLVSVGCVVVGRLLTQTEAFAPEHVRSLVASTGALGVLATVGIFVVGGTLWVPGILLVAATIYAHGLGAGIPIAFVASCLSVVANFAFARSVGGQPLAAIRRPFVKRALGWVERHPIRAIVVLRSVFFLAQWLTYGMALSRIRTRDFLIGTVLGLVVPVVVVSLVFDRVIRW